MPSQAKAPIELQLDSAANLEFYRMRDDFVRAYQPATEEEKLLVIQMARAWKHLQEVYEFRDRLTAKKGLLGLFEDDFNKYKFLMRNMTEAERMWRHATLAFQKAHRRRDHLAPPRSSNVSTIPSFRPATSPAAVASAEPQSACPEPASGTKTPARAPAPLPKNST
jgi:hypothetical protein